MSARFVQGGEPSGRARLMNGTFCRGRRRVREDARSKWVAREPEGDYLRKVCVVLSRRARNHGRTTISAKFGAAGNDGSTDTER